MKASTIAVSLALLVVAATACTSANVTRMGQEYSARPDGWPVAVYASGDAPREVTSLAYVGTGQPPGWRIGRMAVKESMFTTDWDRSIDEAKEQARRIGGDAIYIGPGGRFGAATTARSDLEVYVYRCNDD
ncbi:MAG: hypothetical protein ABFS86_18655 [Planctomycetota bacterium]